MHSFHRTAWSCRKQNWDKEHPPHYKGVVPGVYHFSDEGVCSWYDFTKAIHRIAGITTCKVSPLHTNEYPAKTPRPHYSVLDKTKIKTTYNIEIPHWEESLEACIKELNA